MTDASTLQPSLHIGAAVEADVPQIFHLICELADYERLSHLVVATEDDIHSALFGSSPVAEVILGWEDKYKTSQPVAFALFFHNFSTFLGRKGLYLEDLFVRPAFRRRGYARALLVHLARLAVERGCGRFEWSVLDWNAQAIAFYESLGATIFSEWKLTRVTGDALTRLAGEPLLPAPGLTSAAATPS